MAHQITSGSYVKAMEEKHQREMFYKAVLNNIDSGAIFTDLGGEVIFLGKSNGLFTGINLPKQLTFHSHALNESSVMPIIARTGMPEINNVLQIMGRNLHSDIHKTNCAKTRSSKLIGMHQIVLYKKINNLVYG